MNDQCSVRCWKRGGCCRSINASLFAATCEWHNLALVYMVIFSSNDVLGAGGQCEGEDWQRLGQIPQIDYLIMHVYERHMELLPEPSGNPKWPNWIFCDFKCYANWFVEYLNIHMKIVERIKKPLVLEEFGVTWWKSSLDDRKVLFDYVFER